MTEFTVDFNVNLPLEGGKTDSSSNEASSGDHPDGSTNTLSKIVSKSIGIFGYSFKGPEKFGSISRAEILNSDILHYIDHRRSHTARAVSRRSKSNSFGNTEGLEEMSKFPIKFKNAPLEDLYSLNLNSWMIRRLPFVAIAGFFITVVFWPLSIVSLKKAGAWRDEEYIYILFHLIMTIISIVEFIPLLGLFKRLTHLTEKFCFISLTSINFLWGCWHILASYSLRNDHTKLGISEIIMARESIKALNYIYGILPIVALDSFLPTRTSQTWWVHLQFIIFHGASTVIKGHSNSSYLPWIYIIFRIFSHSAIVGLLYFGSYNSEVQTRISFYNWLTTSRKIAVLENEITGIKGPTKSFTPAEIILVNIKRCLRIAYLSKDASGDMFPEISEPLTHMCKVLRKCISQLTNSANLFAIPNSQLYEDLGEERDIVDSYIASYFDRPRPIKTKSFDNVPADTKSPLARHSVHDRRFMRYLGQVPSVESKANLFHLLNEWNFNVIDHFRKDPQPFISLGYSLLEDFERHYKIPDNRVLNFLNVIQGLYRNVSYHNSMHGMFVAQKVCCLANFIGFYEKMSVLDRAVLTVSAICHDVGHPGKTNSFYVNSNHGIAQLFNDKAVLENYHTCLTFNVLKMEECNIFGFLSSEEMRQVRRRIIELILATDMEDHFEAISRFRLKRVSGDFNPDKETASICKMLIKAADIGSTCISWDQSYEWAQRITIEFYAQGKMEMNLGLPVSAFCDPNRYRDLPKAQSGFLRLLVAPLFEEISKITNRHDGQYPSGYNPYGSELSKTGTETSFWNSNLQNDRHRRAGPPARPFQEDEEAEFEELVTGKIPSSFSGAIQFEESSEESQHHSFRGSTSANRVLAVCLFHLQDNVEHWEQMADLGETIPIDKFAHEDVNLDIKLAIQL